ncbi:hypothetical protein HYV74_02135 [Candidatus Uhrbacteria bacterium]|nr:hypothetical protein [Candidatus Uhrbacteria bacterium]
MHRYGLLITSCTHTCTACGRTWEGRYGLELKNDIPTLPAWAPQDSSCIACGHTPVTIALPNPFPPLSDIAAETQTPQSERAAHIVLGVTGSVAAKRTPPLALELSRSIGRVDIVASARSFTFWDPHTLSTERQAQNHGYSYRVWRDEDEWGTGQYERGAMIPHITLREWGDVLCVAPCTANTLAKMAAGICDTLLTSIVRAWRRDRPLVIAPAMNTQMWEHPATAEHLATLRRWYPKCTVVDPVVKTLACGEHGVGAMADIEDIRYHVAAALDCDRTRDRDAAACLDDWHRRVRDRACDLRADDDEWAEHGGC